MDAAYQAPLSPQAFFAVSLDGRFDVFHALSQEMRKSLSRSDSGAGQSGSVVQWKVVYFGKNHPRTCA